MTVPWNADDDAFDREQAYRDELRAMPTLREPPKEKPGEPVFPLEEVECPVCYGAGFFDGEPAYGGNTARVNRCHYCGGVGRVYVRKRAPK